MSRSTITLADGIQRYSADGMRLLLLMLETAQKSQILKPRLQMLHFYVYMRKSNG
jgi:hypothetical protein